MKYRNALEVAENPVRLCMLSFDDCGKLLESLDLDAALADILGEPHDLQRIKRAVAQVQAHGAAILEASEKSPEVLH